MKCEKCQQREATVYLNQTLNGETKEVHLCEVCAKENEGILFNDGLSFQQFLSGLLKNNKSPQIKSVDLTCPKCGMTFGDFKTKSKVGCAHCYKVFDTHLQPIVKRLQGSLYHTGKRPSKLNQKIQLQNKMETYESDLKIALMKEDYEQAAVIRDLIKDLKKEAEL
ncbi:MAG: UvrB/UvrC motif-containing protein [Vallitaleaceae bacterium]|nr:UvrB/UvrC motif-containing protein [Vallitaleaceae bacterium]